MAAARGEINVRLLYAGILDQVERMEYDVFTARAVVPAIRKAQLVGGSLLRSTR